MRDNFKDLLYFDNFIKTYHENVVLLDSQLINGSIPKERLHIAKNVQAKSYLALLKAKYSRGDDMNSSLILDIYNKMVFHLYESHIDNRIEMITYRDNGEIINLNQYTFSGFLGILDVLSLSVLLDVKKDTLKLLRKLIANDKVRDYLLNYLIQFKSNDIESLSEESYSDESYMHINDKFKMLKDVIFESNNKISEKNLNIFLNQKWYHCLKGTGYYNQHKKKFYGYSGYWCFIAAAIVKIKGLDDSGFRHNSYYPKDLVNF